MILLLMVNCTVQLLPRHAWEHCTTERAEAQYSQKEALCYKAYPGGKIDAFAAYGQLHKAAAVKTCLAAQHHLKG